jgi:fatty acid-binding protein DegV
MDKLDFKDMKCVSSTMINGERRYIWRPKTKEEIDQAKQFVSLKVTSLPMSKTFKKIFKKLWKL